MCPRRRLDFPASLSLTPFLDHADVEISQSLSLTPFLDHADVEISQSLGQGGPLAPDPVISSIGHLLPIALCGRSSL